RGVGDTGGLQVLLSLRGDGARIAGVRLIRERVHDREVDDQRLPLAEGVEVRSLQIRDELHVRLVDRLESTDRGAVEELALSDGLLVEGARGDVEVLHDPGEVAELDVDELDTLLLDVLRDL